MNTNHGKARLRTVWRLSRRLLLALLALLLPWLAWNWNDEAPNAAALQLSQPLASSVADADNAWLFLIGLSAAPNEDPIVLGRRRVDALSSDSGESTLVDGPLPLELPQLPRDSTPVFCPYHIVNCLDWTQIHAVTLQRLRQANALRQQRVATLLALPQWLNVHNESLGRLPPAPNYNNLHLYYDLLALDAGKALATNDAAALDAVLRRMADTVTFFRRVQAQPQDQLSLMTSIIGITRQLQLLDQLLDRLDAQQITALRPSIAVILQAPAKPFDWSESIRRDYAASVAITASLGEFKDYRRCVDLGQEDCLLKRVQGLAFQPQAMHNRLAENYLDILRARQQPAPQLKLALAQAYDQAQQRNPGFDSFINSLRAIAYNPIGNAIVAATIKNPANDPADRLHDAEAQRRSVAMKVEALVQGVAIADLPAFLDAHAATLGNPWTGQALDWDPRQREIGFVPRSTFYERAHPGARYQPLPAAGVKACATPLRLELRETRDGKARQAHTVLSCGVGNIAHSVTAQDESPDGQRYVEVRAVVADGRIDVEALLQSENGHLLLYATRGADAAADSLWLDPVAIVGAGNGTRIDVKLTPATDAAPLISIAGPALPAGALLQQIATTAEVRIDNAELAGEQRVGLAFDIPAQTAVERIAHAAGRQAQTLDPRHFVLAREPTTAGKR
jgi:hypothetical protein